MIKGISSNRSNLFTSMQSNKVETENIQNEKIEKSKKNSIKESINNGTYKIDIEKTSKKMAKTLL